MSFPQMQIDSCEHLSGSELFLPQLFGGSAARDEGFPVCIAAELHFSATVR